MPDSPPSSHSPLPESLRIQLARFRAHLWRIKIMEAVAAGCIGLLVSYLLVFALDRIWPTPGWARLLVLLSGASLFAGFAPYWWHKWVWKQRRETQLARLIALRYPGLGDRLLGVIELEHQAADPHSLSPRLREAAMIAVAAETGKRTLDDAIPTPWHRKGALLAILLAVLAASVLVVTPRAGLNALQRWLMPLSTTERYTFTRLQDAPSHLLVPFGESFEISLRLAPDSENRPEKARGRLARQPAVEVTREGDQYRLRFPGQQDPGTLDVRIGDLRHSIAVTPVLRPAIQSVKAHVVPPAYLGHEPRTEDLNNGLLGMVEGSRFHIEIKTSRGLSRAEYGPSRSVAGEAAVSETTSPSPPVAGPLAIQQETARTPEIQPSHSLELPFSWTDTIGLTGDGRFQVQVEVSPDAAPACYLQGIDRQKALLPEETVELEIIAEDDLGLRHIGLEWQGEFTRPTDQKPAKGELRLGGDSRERRSLLPAVFSPSAFGIGPQKLTLRGYVEDALPGRGRIHSEPVVLYILTLDEHAQLVKSRFDRQISELEDMARRELDLLEENERLERLDSKDLQSDPNQRRIRNQESEEKETARRAEELKQQMEKLLQDAARNKEIEKKTLQKMAESLKSMQELAEQDIPEVQNHLHEAQQPSNTPEQSKKEMAETVRQQRETLEKMRETVDKANDANRNLEAGTFVNRLKKAAADQDGIASSLRSAFQELLGVRTRKLDPRENRRLDEAARQQSETSSDMRWIQEDLASYHARTQDQKFLKLIDAMRDSKVDLGLDEVRLLLGRNFSGRAAEKSAFWAAKFKEWAALLEDQGDQGGGGGGGGGSSNPEDEDFEFMLRVMRMVQQEMDLRGRTRSLEQTRRDAAKSNP